MVDMIKCDNCEYKFDLDKLSDEQFIGAYESRGEFWGAPCSEYMVYGCYCPECGHKIEW